MHYVGGMVPANRMLLRNNTGENYMRPKTMGCAGTGDPDDLGYDTPTIPGMEGPPPDRAVKPSDVQAKAFGGSRPYWNP